MAVFVVGDIHGCIDELQRLLDKARFDPAKDTLWSVGDLVGRGPHSHLVLNFVRDLGDAFQMVLGNHDLHLLAVLSGVREAADKDRTEQVRYANQAENWVDWLRGQPLMRQHASYKLAMVHAGIYPEWSIDEAQIYADEVSHQLQQDNFTDYLATMYHNEPAVWDPELDSLSRFRFIVNAFTRMRFCQRTFPHNRIALELTCKLPPEQATDALQPWFNFFPASPITLVFGHWAALNGNCPRSDIVALDTGCVWGNKLTAMVFPDQRRIQQYAITQ